MPTQRLSSESQCSADSALSCDIVASCWPISAHSFERQPTKETAAAVDIEETAAKSEAVTVDL
jgi:hypothetical protein